jgi:hypothetical protein
MNHDRRRKYVLLVVRDFPGVWGNDGRQTRAPWGLGLAVVRGFGPNSGLMPREYRYGIPAGIWSGDNGRYRVPMSANLTPRDNLD